MSDILETVDRGAVRVFTLTRPERRNAINARLARELRAAVDDAAANPAIRCIVLTGAGGAFSSGGDLLRDTSEPGESDLLADIHDCFRSIHLGPKPAFAAVEGPAFGAGLSLALACDFIIAAHGARFAAPFTGIGLVPDTGIMWTLPQRVNLRTARTMLLEGTVLTATDAHAAGLLDEVVVDGGAIEAALVRAQRLALRAPLAISATRVAINRGSLDVESALRDEVSAQNRLRGSADFSEGVRAFKEKRAPNFVGR